MSKVSRRVILRATTLIAGAVSLSGCDRVISKVTRELGQQIPDAVSYSCTPEISPEFHLLSRAAHGPWPGDIEKLTKMGVDAWIEEQLNPANIDDNLCELRARRFETIHMPPDMCFEFRKEVLRRDITRHTVLRAVYSQRQLLEVMVGFWTDHLNISLDKGDCVYFKSADDRLVIRPHALGDFRDLIKASAVSPAMLIYLDGKENRKTAPSDIPNENYARELLELHTLGVHGGYSQEDVYQAARCLTGWRVKESDGRGHVYFDATAHDAGEKRVLGKIIPAGGGERDVDLLVDAVCFHPATADHIAKKLCHRFVGETASSDLVRAISRKFSDTKGSIKESVRAVLCSSEFMDTKHRGARFKRPFHFMVSALRILGADTHAHDELLGYLQRMGQGPFQYPTPDGYPDEEAYWADALLWRWNFALALTANQIPASVVLVDRLLKSIGWNEKNPDVEHLIAYFNGRAPSKSELAALQSYIKGKDPSKANHRAELTGLILAMPAFQRY